MRGGRICWKRYISRLDGRRRTAVGGARTYAYKTQADTVDKNQSASCCSCALPVCRRAPGSSSRWITGTSKHTRRVGRTRANQHPNPLPSHTHTQHKIGTAWIRRRPSRKRYRTQHRHERPQQRPQQGKKSSTTSSPSKHLPTRHLYHRSTNPPPASARQALKKPSARAKDSVR